MVWTDVLAFGFQMFGAFFYGFVEKDDVKTYVKISYLANKMDKNDFMMSNSPYSVTYEKPPSRELVVVHSNSPPSPPMTLDSPAEVFTPLNAEWEFVGPYASTDPGVQGIDQFGTNTFQIHAWMFAPAGSEPISPPPAAATALMTSAAPPVFSVSPVRASRLARVTPPVQLSQEEEDAMETDSDFEREQEEKRREDAQQAFGVGTGGDGTDVVMTDTLVSDDILVTNESQCPVPGSVILLSDDEEMDKPRRPYSLNWDKLVILGLQKNKCKVSSGS
jgi:hypothetical protein